MTLDQRPPGPVEPLPEPPPEFDPPEPEFQPRRNGHPAIAATPHDQAAEQYVLGAALLDPTQITTCGPLLTASDFWRPAHETIWRALLRLHAAGEPTEPAAVAAHLLDTDAAAFQRLGGHPYLFELTQACGIPASAPFYATRVEKLARRRTAISSLQQGLARLQRPGDDHDVDEVLHQTAAHLAEARDSLANLPVPTTWSPVDLSSVLSGDYLDPPPTMLMRADGAFLLYDGAVHVIAGESESGKTWLTLFAAVQLLTEDQRVVFVDFEDRADRVIGRLLALGATPDQVRQNFAYIRPDRPLDDDGRHQLTPAITGARLVVLDGVTEAMTLHGYDLNSNADSALFQGLLPRWIADHGPAVAMIDHVVKDKEKQGRFALGAQHKLAGIDGVQYLVQMREPFARGKRGIATVDIGKDRPGHVREHAHGKRIAEFTLDASADGNVLVAHLLAPTHGQTPGDTGTGAPWQPTILMEKISRSVQLSPGLSQKAVLATQNGKTAHKILAIELLVSGGYIGTKAGPRGAVQHFHIRPFYADPDRDPDHQDEPETDPWEDKE